MFLSRRGRFYYVWYVDDEGRKQKIPTHSATRSSALEYLRNLECAVASRKAKRKHVSLEVFLQNLLEYSQTTHRPKTVRIYQTSLREFQKVVGNPFLDKLSPHHVQRFLAAKKVAVSEASLKTYYTNVASAFEVARKWSLISESPFRVIPKPKLVEKSPVHMSPSEFQRLLSVTRREDLQHLFVVAVCTGLRQGELCALHWEDIDFERRIMHVRNGEGFKTKTGRNRVVPLPDQVCLLLREMKPAAISPLVFHRDGGKAPPGIPLKSLQAVCEEGGTQGRIALSYTPSLLCHMAGPSWRLPL